MPSMPERENTPNLPGAFERATLNGLRVPPAGEVEVWRLSLDGDMSLHARCLIVLSEAEKRRAAGFRAAEAGSRFVIAHGYLRHILAGYTGIDPGNLSFIVSEFGKPSLSFAAEGAGIRFNMAHSGDAALVAVSQGREVGVDIESVRRFDDLKVVARRSFSSRELDLLRSCEEDHYDEMFYRLWTRKEAYIKARGGGMSIELTAIDVTDASSSPVSGWPIRDLGMYRGCMCALALEGRITQVRMLDGGTFM